MKAKITYNLPEDQEEYHRANKAKDMALALWDISQVLREIDKYYTGDKPYDEIRTRFYDILTRYDINLDNLIE